MSRTLAALAVVFAGCGGSVGSVHDAPANSDSYMADAAFVPVPMNIYVGAGATTLRAFTLNPTTLALTANGSVTTGAGPSFIAFDPQRRWLVAVNEGDNALESFAIAPNGTLTRVNAMPSGGLGPAHVALDRTGAWALTANYGDGGVAVLPIAADGTLGAAVSTVNAGANAHQIITNAANTLAYVPCKGANYVAIYSFDATTGALTNRRTVASAAGAGPRHITFDPTGAYAFVINENNSTITSYSVDGTGNLTAIESVTSRDTTSGGNTGAEIAFRAAGSYVYASNRGDNKIVRYRFSGGALIEPKWVSTFGMTPRHFSLIENDTALLVANQDSGNIHAFRIAATTGELTAVGEVATPTGAQFVGGISAN